MSQTTVNFQEIKQELNCDDLTAAILTLAQSASSIRVDLQVSDDGYPERLGANIAKAIEAVTEDGAIRLQVDADVFSKVLGQIDTTWGEDGQAKNKPKKRQKTARR